VKRIPPLLAAMRLNQWTKNSLVFAPLIFAYFDRDQQIQPLTDALRTVAAAATFCLLSSAVYLLNDLHDRDQDRSHPSKRFRPIAAGTVSPPLARRTAGLLLVVALAGAVALGTHFTLVLAGYAAIQLAYTCRLKAVALLDVFVIAAGFVLRALSGAVVIDVTVSPWLLLCTFLLALFLALCKRRHELRVIEDVTDEHRTALDGYDSDLLDQLIAITSSGTVVCYALYTLSDATIEKFGTARLGFTIPFVLFGIFRYLDLVYRHEQGERPEKILLTDIPIIVTIVLYGLTVVGILAFQG